MANQHAVVQGTLMQDGQLQLHTPVNLPPGPVEVAVTTLAQPKEDTWMLLERIWSESQALGLKPRRREEIDAEINALRDESEERMREIERVHEESRQAREQPPC